ncbi:MAG: hypothetical protein MI739_05090, partial [Bacteroidales bacterium]|nr:hypothetical protein [Bacteroidales bacterium]
KRIREEGGYEVYALKGFELLSDLVKLLDKTYEITEEDFNKQIKEFPQAIQDYQARIYLWDGIMDARDNSKDETAYLKRLYRYFDTFKVIRLMNYLAENAYPKREVAIMAADLADAMGLTYEEKTEESLLESYRRFDRIGEK